MLGILQRGDVPNGQYIVMIRAVVSKRPRRSITCCDDCQFADKTDLKYISKEIVWPQSTQACVQKRTSCWLNEDALNLNVQNEENLRALLGFRFCFEVLSILMVVLFAIRACSGVLLLFPVRCNWVIVVVVVVVVSHCAASHTTLSAQL